MKCKDLKKQVIAKSQEVIKEKLALLAAELDHLLKDISEDTKSSAGDKFETTRELVNTERQQLYARVEDLNKMLAALTTLPPGAANTVDFGNLVQTDKNWLLIAVSLGPIEVAGEQVLVISPMAPLGKAFQGKQIKDKVAFNNVSYQIAGIC